MSIVLFPLSRTCSVVIIEVAVKQGNGTQGQQYNETVYMTRKGTMRIVHDKLWCI